MDLPVRSEADAVEQTLKITLGGKQYEVRPLSIKKARAWRDKLTPLINKMTSRDGALDSPEKLLSAIQGSPDEMAEIVFSYCGIDEKEVEETANELDISRAFGAIMGIAFAPFLSQQAVIKSLIQIHALQPLGKSTK
jgi:hypothetical protein